MGKRIAGAGALKRALAGTTALIGTALLVAPLAARAANITITAATNATQSLSAGDTLTVTNTGSISGVNPAVSVLNAAAVSITNSGAISGTGKGIEIVSTGNISGGITNSGTIHGSSNAGIFVRSHSNISGGITNSGTISGGSGILVTSNSDISGGIVNQAGGVISGANSAGIEVFHSDVSGGVTNSGTIQGKTVGVLVVVSSNISGGVLNRGTISGGASGMGIFVGTHSDISGGITNSGTISGGSGILVTSNSDISGGIVNQAGGVITGNTGILVSNGKISGGITNAGTIDGTGGTAISLVGLTGSTPITISGGQIIGDVTDSNPAGNFSDVTVGGNFTTNGNFNVSDLQVTGGNMLTIKSGNKITLDHQTASAGTLDFGVTSAASFGSIAVTGAPDLTGTTIKVAVAPSPTLANGDQLLIIQGGAPVVGGPGATLTPVADNSAVWDFSIANGGNPDDVFLFVTAASAQGTCGVAATPNNKAACGILEANSSTTNPQLQQILTNINGAATTQGVNKILEATLPTVDDSGRTAALDVSDNVLGLLGERLTALRDGEDGDTGMSAGDSSGMAAEGAPVVPPREAGQTLPYADAETQRTVQPSQTGNNVRAHIASDRYGPEGLTADDIESDDAAQTVSATGHVELVQSGNIIRADKIVYSLTSDRVSAQGHVVIATADGDVHFADEMQLTQQTGNGFVKVLETALTNPDKSEPGERLAGLSGGPESGASGMSAGDGYASGKSNDNTSLLNQTKQVMPIAFRDEKPDSEMWMQGFGRDANQGERDNIAGYHANTWGGAAGMDTRNIADNLVAGVAVSYGRTDARSNNANTTDTGVDSYQLTLYGDYDPKGETYIDGLAAYSFNRNETMRHDVGGVAGLTAHGHDDADQVTAQVEAGREYAAGETILTPDIMAHGVWYKPGSYTETGAGGADLNVSGNSQSLLELGAGIKAGWIYGESDGSIIKPQLRAGYRYALVDDRIDDTAQFTGGGGTFTTQGPNPARSSVNLGGTLRYYTPSRWSFTASYDFDWKQSYTANAGYIKAGYRF